MSVVSRFVMVVCGVLCAVAGVAFAAPMALAADGVVGFFGSSGTGDGQFSTPRGVAVDPATGNVFVVDSGNNRVQQFSVSSSAGEAPQGTFVSQFGGAGAGAGQLSAPQGIAVDSSGNVFVTDQTNRRVDVFSTAGSFEGAFGWGVVSGDTSTAGLDFCTTATGCQAGLSGPGSGEFGTAIGYPAIDPTSGDVYVADPANQRVQQFSVTVAGGAVTGVSFVKAFGGAGTATSQFGSGSPTRVAVDSTGDVYAVDNGNARVEKFDSLGNPIAIFGSAQLSGAPSPTDVAVDPANGHVFVVKPCNATICAGAGNTSERRVLELDSAGTLISTQASGAGITSVNGLAFDPSQGNLYLAGSPFNAPAGITQGAFILNTPLIPPTSTVSAPTDVTGTGATFNGSVDPTGFSTGYHFEYSADDLNWTKLPVTDVNVGAGTTGVQVTQSATQLLPSQLYHLRLVATKPFGAGSATSAETTFTTRSLPPAVTTFAASVTTGEGTLNGTVNPENEATTYHFEFGTTTSYGTTLPVPDGGLGSGGSDVAVSQPVSGLTLGTTYHFRLVATNRTGTTDGPDETFTASANATSESCPNDAIRAQESAANLPDCRAYEQVSPVDKDGFDVASPAQAVAADGNSIAYASRGAFAGEQSNAGAPINEYLATRDGSGWSTQGLEPPLYNAAAFTMVGQYEGWSEDLQHSVVEVKVTGDPQDIYLRGPDGSLTLVNPGAAVDTFGSGPPPLYQGASPDFSHVLFQGSAGFEEWVNGSASSVSATEVPSQCTTGQSGQSGPGGNCSTASVSVSPTAFVNSDGYLTSIAYFTSNRELTDNANTGTAGQGTDLYAYDAQTGKLTDVSHDSNSADTNGAQVQGLVGGTDDGSYVYFVAEGALASGASSGTCSPCNLYVSHNGTITFIAPVSINDGVFSPKQSERITRAQVSADGTHLLFTSAVSLTGYDNAGQSEIYTYDAGSDKLTCLSCNPSGAPATGSADLSQGQLNSFVLQRNMSADGTRVFFQTPEALVQRDTNGAGGCPFFFGAPSCLDVYEWEADGTGSCQSNASNGGCLYLISSGHSDSPSFFEGSTASGDDVFFATRDQLVGQDTDTSLDVYDARVDGGIATQNPQPAVSCGGTACRGAAVAPSVPVAASVTFTGPGSLRPAARPAKPLVLTRIVHGATFISKVKVPAAGRIAIAGASVRTVRRSVAKAGTYRLKVTLTATAKKALAYKHKLKLRLHVTYDPARGPSSSATAVVMVMPAVRDRTGHARRASNHNLGSAR